VETAGPAGFPERGGAAEWQAGEDVARDQAGLEGCPDCSATVTAAVFQLDFGILDKDRPALEQFSRWDVKRCYDKPCELLASLGVGGFCSDKRMEVGEMV